MTYEFENANEQGNGEEHGPVTLARYRRSPRLAEIKAVYRSRTKLEERKPIRAPRDVESYLRAVWNRQTIELTEDFVVVCLNGNHETLGWIKVSSGGFGSTTVDPRLVFAVALQTASTAIVLAHNHPSGSLQPSEQDRDVTRQIREAGKLLRIAVLDHVILTKESFFSFAENGFL
jgi:DNA repair protein RadC